MLKLCLFQRAIHIAAWIHAITVALAADIQRRHSAVHDLADTAAAGLGHIEYPVGPAQARRLFQPGGPRSDFALLVQTPDQAVIRIRDVQLPIRAGGKAGWPGKGHLSARAIRLAFHAGAGSGADRLSIDVAHHIGRGIRNGISVQIRGNGPRLHEAGLIQLCVYIGAGRLTVEIRDAGLARPAGDGVIFHAPDDLIEGIRYQQRIFVRSQAGQRASGKILRLQRTGTQRDHRQQCQRQHHGQQLFLHIAPPCESNSSSVRHSKPSAFPLSLMVLPSEVVRARSPSASATAREI